MLNIKLVMSINFFIYRAQIHCIFPWGDKSALIIWLILTISWWKLLLSTDSDYLDNMSVHLYYLVVYVCFLNNNKKFTFKPLVLLITKICAFTLHWQVIW